MWIHQVLKTLIVPWKIIIFILSFENISEQIHTPIPIVLESVESFGKWWIYWMFRKFVWTDEFFIPINFESTDESEGTFNHWHCYVSSAGETRLVSIWPQPNIDNKYISIAPGQQPNSILNYRYYEEISSGYFFPTGKSGYQVQWDTPLSPLKYFNKRLLNYSQNFAADTGYTFFAWSVLQSLSLQEMNIAMRKVLGGHSNARVFNNYCFSELVKQCVWYLQIYEFSKRNSILLKKIKMKGPGWGKTIPHSNIFFTLSCVDFICWNNSKIKWR